MAGGLHSMTGAAGGLAVSTGTPYAIAKIWNTPAVVDFMTSATRFVPQTRNQWLTQIAKIEAAGQTDLANQMRQRLNDIYPKRQ